MAEQSFLTKLGMRFGTLGIAASLAMAAPLATGDYNTTCGTDSNRVGWYFDRTVGVERIVEVVGGASGILHTRGGTTVNCNVTGTITVGDGTVLASVYVNGVAGGARDLLYQTAGVARWVVRADGTSESGSNAGSLYSIIARHDSGSQIDVPWQITRAQATPNTGVITTTKSILITNNSSPQFAMSSASGQSRQYDFRTSLTGRWSAQCNGTAESGSNAGSNWQLVAQNDAGTTIDSPIFLFRVALGSFSNARPTLIAAGTLTGTETACSSTATWSNVATTFTGLRLNVTTTNSAAGSLLLDLQVGNVSRFKVTDSAITSPLTIGGFTMAAVDTDLLTIGVYTLGRTTALTVGVADGYASIATTVINGSATVTRMNWIELDDVTGSTTVTDGTVFWFDAAAGVHKCIDSGTTKTSPGTVSSWIKHNINGTIYYSNAYTSKTS